MKESGLRTRKLSRRDFLRVGGAGLAGVTLLGAAGCGGGGQQGGATELVFTSAPDDTETTPKLVQRFNEQNRGKYRVVFREGNADTGQRFDQLRTEMQAGGENIDIILGDVIWTAQLAANGWISDISDRFRDRDEFLPGSVEAIIYEGKAYGMPWFTDTGLLYYRKDLLRKSGFERGPKTWNELKEMAKKVMQDSPARGRSGHHGREQRAAAGEGQGWLLDGYGARGCTGQGARVILPDRPRGRSGCCEAGRVGGRRGGWDLARTVGSGRGGCAWEDPRPERCLGLQRPGPCTLRGDADTSGRSGPRGDGASTPEAAYGSRPCRLRAPGEDREGAQTPAGARHDDRSLRQASVSDRTETRAALV